jgi:hypothetical protein
MNAAQLVSLIEKYAPQYEAAKNAGKTYDLNEAQYAQLMMVADIEQRVSQLESLEKKLAFAEQTHKEEQKTWAEETQWFKNEIKKLNQLIASIT